ncbi:YtpR family tRNA-binding protein [Latilactobacillus fuchuensis]|jgi:tRNA-binding protein|uniref:Aminoacyl-tRNA synthetase n=2 Tax=Latilactobacillus fuchuensis TaxID=164393 RepID=A0A2N9DUE1_9LACO|nr:DUF4479 and tRNA-binding domain-containing protein [Latilactobacillus fuchuensis]KRL61582.1 hypothetical protein FC69_GL000551 [Latilactobacillus fuchuensis DSM 14340 = JCM 11249]SPC37650.1 Aminoacyl-tRNA synthetase [Latilactobacillus fuchuensis]
MLIASMNQKAFQNILVVMVQPDAEQQVSTEKQGIVRISDQNDQTIGYNFLAIDQILPELQFNGTQVLTIADVAALNTALSAAGFPADLVADETPHIVVGYVQECDVHPDSDHMHITQTEIAPGQTVQIVCGASNIAQGQKVIVATVGAVMPEGKIIWPGQLRGVQSDGMICAAREIGVVNAPDKGIMVLPDDWQVGQAVTPEAVATLLK